MTLGPGPAASPLKHLPHLYPLWWQHARFSAGWEPAHFQLSAPNSSASCHGMETSTPCPPAPAGTGEARETSLRRGDKLTPKAQAGHLSVGTEDTSLCLVAVQGGSLITGPLSTQLLVDVAAAV